MRLPVTTTSSTGVAVAAFEAGGPDCATATPHSPAASTAVSTRGPAGNRDSSAQPGRNAPVRTEKQIIAGVLPQPPGVARGGSEASDANFVLTSQHAPEDPDAARAAESGARTGLFPAEVYGSDICATTRLHALRRGSIPAQYRLAAARAVRKPAH